MKYRITRPGLPAIMFGSGYDCWLLYRGALLRHSLEAAARQPGAELQRLREESVAEGRSGWERPWQTCAKRSCEKCVVLRDWH